MRWFGRVQRSEFIGGRMPRLELAGRRTRWEPEWRFIRAVKDNVNWVGVREEDKEDGGEEDASTVVTREEKGKGERPFLSAARLCTTQQLQ